MILKYETNKYLTLDILLIYIVLLTYEMYLFLYIYVIQ